MTEFPTNPDGTPIRNGYVYTHEGPGVFMAVVSTLQYYNGPLIGHLDMIDIDEEIWEYSYSKLHHIFVVLKPQ